jgi:hypothetical protein
MRVEYYLVPSPKRNRTHIREILFNHILDMNYLCGISPKEKDKFQSRKENEYMKLCKNCVRILEARRER